MITISARNFCNCLTFNSCTPQIKKTMKELAVIILAGGSGHRMGSELPKQFLSLRDKPILMHTIGRFAQAVPDSRIIVVLPQGHIDYWNTLCTEHGFTIPHQLCSGGTTRYESVKAGLGRIGEVRYVAVHDGVRPLVGKALIRKVIADAKALGTAVPVITPVESLRRVDDRGSHAVNRNDYRIVQTPQVFRADILIEAYERPFRESFTDDASVVEENGGTIYLSEGSYDNIKITTPVDLVTAEALYDAAINAESR